MLSPDLGTVSFCAKLFWGVDTEQIFSALNVWLMLREIQIV
jgi:hypothetical protein